MMLGNEVAEVKCLITLLSIAWACIMICVCLYVCVSVSVSVYLCVLQYVIVTVWVIACSNIPYNSLYS